MILDVRRQLAGLALVTTCALGGATWAAMARSSDAPRQEAEQIASVGPLPAISPLDSTPESPAAPATTALPTAAPTTTPTTSAPATTAPATRPTTAPAAPTTQGPTTTPSVTSAGGWGNLGASVQQHMLAMVNAKRASGTTCGGTAYPPVPPLSLDSTIVRASDAYAADMATHGYFSHTGRDGSDPGQRLSAAGYRWSAWAENIAVGQATPEAVVAGWFGSTGHCTNFMRSEVTQVGFGMVDDPSSAYRYYWVADLSRPA